MHLVAPRSHCARALLLGGLLLAGCSKSEQPASSTTPPSAAPTPAAPQASAAPTAAAQVAHDKRRSRRYKGAKLMTRAGQSCPPVTNDHIWRFIDGLDECPRVLADAEIAKELADPWAANVLRANEFPTSVDAIVAAISSRIPKVAAGKKSYMVGEGGQVQLSIAPRDADRNLRYVVTWGDDEHTDIFLSALPGGSSSFLQLIAWDPTKNRFNFYEYSTERPGWVWAGDSSYARAKETLGHGCFDCHHNGTVIMKELATPWNNWHSMKVGINPSVVPEAVAKEALFQHLTTAEQLESSVRGGFQRYHNARLRGLVQRQPDGSLQVGEAADLLSHVISPSTVNLASTEVVSDPSRATDGQAPISGLPNEFFLHDGVLQGVLRLGYTVPAALSIGRAAYGEYLKTHEYRLVQEAEEGIGGYQAPGSTYFAFLVPVAAPEDTFVIQLLLGMKLVTPKFVAAVQMVDFSNPIFSSVRDTLMKYAAQIPSGTITKNQSDVPARFAALVTQGAQGQPPCEAARLDRCTAEQQFLFFWNLPDAQWQKEAQTRVQAYLNAVGQRLGTPQGVNDYMQLAVSRHAQFKQWPVIGHLVEFSLLFPRTNLPATPLQRMNTDGTIGPI